MSQQSSLQLLPNAEAEIVLWKRPANERWCYNVSLSLIGWVDTQSDPCWGIFNYIKLPYVGQFQGQYIPTDSFTSKLTKPGMGLGHG